MLLRMASPIRRDGSSVHYLRKRVPADLSAKAVGLVLHVPVGRETAAVRVGNAGTIKVSLRTHDPREAKARQAKALAYLDDMWRALRAGPQRLSNRHVVALAGEWYRAAKATWENDPGRATLWGILKSAAQNWDVETVQREMAPFVAEVLAERALNADDDSRTRLAKAMHATFRDATGLLERRARGDYGPDEVEQRSPAWQPEGAQSSPAALPIAELLAGWELEGRAGGITDKTVSEYRSVFTRFAAFLGHDDAIRITPHDVVRWKDKRLADGRSPKTVKDVDLSAMKSMFGWAVRNHKLPTNPAQGITLKIGKKARERGKGLTQEEAKSILTAALCYSGTAQEHPKTVAAKRWLPWLCAYSGARIREVAQLRRDVRRAETYAAQLLVLPAAEFLPPGKAQAINLNRVKVTTDLRFRLRRVTRTNKVRIGGAAFRYAKGKPLAIEVANWQSAFMQGYLHATNAEADAEVEGQLCITIDAVGGVCHRSPTDAQSRYGNMAAACATIAEWWPNVSPPEGAVYE